MFTGLLSTAIVWIFTQSLNVAPVIESVNNLSKAMYKSEEMNTEILGMIYKQNERMGRNETKLIRVMSDCQNNRNQLIECQRRFYSLPTNKTEK